MKVLAIGASTSSKSINRIFANYVANLIPSAVVTDYNLSHLSLPIYSMDEEETNGIPEVIRQFNREIENHDAIVLSLAEHNGSYAAAYKNIFDWASREQYKVWAGKPLFLLSTSPGTRGGASVLAAAKVTYPYLGANIKASYSLPSFYDNFTDGRLANPELKASLDEAIKSFLKGASGN